MPSQADNGCTNPPSYFPRHATNGVAEPRPLARSRANSPSSLRAVPINEVHDIVCVGFGPAALAIAVAINDALDARQLRRPPRVCFLEKQDRFTWHGGMQLPGASMQISWIKDLATIRDPRSRFTFLNYLHCKGRLLAFSDLGTFLPKRREYEDYMRWCAEAFDDVVCYNSAAHEVFPSYPDSSTHPVDIFGVKTTNQRTGHEEIRYARHVIIAGGGKPTIPSQFPQHHPRVIHSSGYMYQIPALLTDRLGSYRIAVIGAGQSAAEVFNDLQTRFPNSQTRLIIRGAALKPSDDSPFVNEIFDPKKTDGLFNAASEVRARDIERNRDTNYSVVRPALLEQIYANLYDQHLDYPSKDDWAHQILNYCDVEAIKTQHDGDEPIRLDITNYGPCHDGTGLARNEEFTMDAVIIATGYQRNLHDQLLANAENLRSKNTSSRASAGWEVSRDYRTKFEDDKVSARAGVWLQGCCEETHGLSDTLLSVLAPRSGELVQSIFGSETSMCDREGSVLKPSRDAAMGTVPNGIEHNGIDGEGKSDACDKYADACDKYVNGFVNGHT